MPFSPIHLIPFDKNQIAVALGESLLGSGHLGVAFHSVKDGPQLLHLAWHQDLRIENVPNKLAGQKWVATALDAPSMTSKQLVAIIRSVSQRLPKINYGIDFIAAKGSFSQSKYAPPKGSDGLTCASFVVEILRAGAIELVKEETWPVSNENVGWGEEVCRMLESTNALPAHIAAVRKNIKGLRLRPYEVAAAAALPKAQRPVTYEAIQPNTKEAENALLRAPAIPFVPCIPDSSH